MRMQIVIIIIILSVLIGSSNDADGQPACTPPANGNWVVDSDCQLLVSASIRGNVFIEDNSDLIIPPGRDLNIDLSQNRIDIESGSHLIVRNTGRVHTLMIDDTDGRVGYYLKEVNGPVLYSHNANTIFYPASTIKVLQHAHAMREVQAGNVNLNTSILTVCDTTGVNCSDNANSNANCGGNTISETLSTALRRMMRNSNNRSTNAVQEFFGGGDPSLGRSLMNQMGWFILGLSNGTELHHKMACGNVSNNPSNEARLTDLAEIYEEIGEDDNVLSGSAKANFYSLMLNETNDGFINDINSVVDLENLAVGLSAGQLNAFKGSIRTARKAGNVTCCFSNAGWIQLPLSDGASSVQYVFGVFIDDFNNNNVDMNEAVADMLRKSIREAMSTWSSS